MLDLKALLTKVLSAFGIHSNGSWRYVILGKFFIGACSFTGSLTITTAIGNVYQTGSNSNITLPVTLRNCVYADVKVMTSNYGVWTYMISKGNTLYYRAMSALSRSTASYTICAIVIGIV